eukprot:gb/GECH01011329.1/.p1 GENE.gb/GECH01011329.1/~~gb/GECH01011329.1/.p1  ORF type:complete len:222 (+),score=46.28 gb/GECH01011329.1/:1-666(+)
MDLRSGCPDKIFEDISMTFMLGLSISTFTGRIGQVLPKHMYRNRYWPVPYVVPIQRAARTQGGRAVAMAAYVPHNIRRTIVRQNIQRSALRFARWGMVFSAVGCVASFIRGREDFLNTLIGAGLSNSYMKRRRDKPMNRRFRTFSGAALLLGSMELMLDLMLWEGDNDAEDHATQLYPPNPNPPLEARLQHRMNELIMVPRTRQRQPVWLPPEFFDTYDFV